MRTLHHLRRTRVLCKVDAIGDRRRSGRSVVAKLWKLRRCLARVVRRYHVCLEDLVLLLLLWWWWWRRGIAFFVRAIITAAVEIAWPFVFVWTAVVRVATNKIAHIIRRVFVQLLVAAKDNDSDIDGAEDGQLVCLLKQTPLSFQKRSASRSARNGQIAGGAQERAVTTYTERLRSSLIALISIFLRPMMKY